MYLFVTTKHERIKRLLRYENEFTEIKLKSLRCAFESFHFNRSFRLASLKAWRYNNLRAENNLHIRLPEMYSCCTIFEISWLKLVSKLLGFRILSRDVFRTLSNSIMEFFCEDSEQLSTCIGLS